MLCIHLQVYAGIFPVDQSDHASLRTAIEKLTLNDSGVEVNLDSRYCTSTSLDKAHGHSRIHRPWQLALNTTLFPAEAMNIHNI